MKRPIPVICIVGKSEAGKTTLIENLIQELKRKGLKIGAIKHCEHGFELDRKGKDSYRLKEAGASLVLISSPQKIALIKDTDVEYPLDGLIENFIQDVDVVLVEGFKRSSYPKIEVFRKDLCEELLCSEDENLIAVVSDKKLNLNLPFFRPDEISRLAVFIVERFIKNFKRK